jgi:hypothetical protein
MVNAISKDGLTVYRFVGVTFDENYKEGQDVLNQAISEGYKITRDYQTESGIVFSLVLENQLVVDPNQRTLDYYVPVVVNSEREQKR